MSPEMTPLHGSTGISPCGGAEASADWTVSVPDGLGGDIGSAPASRVSPGVYDVPCAIARRIAPGGSVVITGPVIGRRELWVYTRRTVREGITRLWCNPEPRRQRFMFRSRRSG